MRSITIRTFLSIAGTLLFAAPVSAAENSAATKAFNVNITLYMLVGIMLTLLFVIGMLAHIMKQLSLVAKEKNRQEKREKGSKSGIIGAILLTVLLPLTSHAADTSKAYQLPDSIDGIAFGDFCLLTGIILLELLVIFFLALNIWSLLKAIKGEQAEAAGIQAKRTSWFWDRFNGAASVEKEKEILLDHNYDGIQELDNSLPPWWKYGFYLTILVGIIYIYRYHISHDGQSQEEEYVAEMQKGEEDKAAYLAQSANNVDESNVQQLSDGAALAAGKEVFIKNCAACHVADGGGSVGPNLTDDYWLHGGGIKEVFKSVKYGWQDKGMKSWKDDLSPIQIQQVASYIKSLKGTHPASPKAPQGDLYMEVAKTDSAKVAAK